MRLGLGLGLSRAAARQRAGVVAAATESLFSRVSDIGATNGTSDSALTLGAVFYVQNAGYINGAWFWKTATDVNTSRSVGLYANGGGALLASGTTSAEPVGTARWVYAAFTTPYLADPLALYVIAVHFPGTAQWSSTSGFYATADKVSASGRIVAPGNVPTSYNGRFDTGVSLVYPSSVSPGNANYWVDVDYTRADWPSAGNTGPTGVLTPASGLLTASTPGATIQNFDRAGAILVAANNVTIKNGRVVATGTSAIQVQAGVTGTVIDHVEIDGSGTVNFGILGLAAVSFCEIYGVENGFTADPGSSIRHSFIHDFGGTDGVAHYDGIEFYGGSGFAAIHNRIDNQKDDTSAINLSNVGAISNADITDNWVSGGSYAIYVDGHFGGGPIDSGTTRVRNNKVGSGVFGWLNYNTATPISTGNFKAEDGTAL